MNMNTYAAEKLMQYRQAAIEKQSRTAWMWNKQSSKESVLPKLIASYTSKKAVVTNAVSDACSSCCAVNP